MPDFNQATPPKSVTDPKNAGANPHYPCLLYKFITEPSATSLIVAWKGKVAVHNEIATATNDADKDAQAKDGYALFPVLDAPVAKKPEPKKDKL